MSQGGAPAVRRGRLEEDRQPGPDQMPNHRRRLRRRHPVVVDVGPFRARERSQQEEGSAVELDVYLWLRGMQEAQIKVCSRRHFEPSEPTKADLVIRSSFATTEKLKVHVEMKHGVLLSKKKGTDLLDEVTTFCVECEI